MTDDDIKCQIVRFAGFDLSLADTKRLITLLETFDIDSLRKEQTTVQVHNTAVVLRELHEVGDLYCTME